MLLPLLFLLPQIASTTPPSGDTAGYWQQRITYTIVARLDEREQNIHARGDLVYVNQSPDTLHEMYFQQYLNAFRPGSRWSAVDEREGRERYQHMKDPDFAYERFTAVPTFDGTPVQPEYPLHPDSTVVRFALPHPLAPGDSMRIHLAWDARPSAKVYRRQGRRGREYDFAQWYPKPVVYDRRGWEPNAFVPSGELYGEFGTYDVSLELPRDQVVAATGVLVQGDPGWERVKRWGTLHYVPGARGSVAVFGDSALPRDYRIVRFIGQHVHQFAWATSPDYVFEGGLYRDTIPVHVLYLPADSARWGNGIAVRNIEHALAWLESIYGPYGYPIAVGLQRLDGGATEFPMLVMYGGMSQGVVLHEMGHLYSYGMLANNEWRSGWMDEGLTSYQTAWAEKTTLPERARGEAPRVPSRVSGYAAHALVPSPLDRGDLGLFHLDLLRRDQPIGIPGYEFSDFGVYNQMVYGRASMMYGALRDAIGDSAFTRFLHDYYARWQFKHVDELAMRASAERASGDSLAWFFDQWVHHTGLIDYALRDVRITRDADGWLTKARIVRVGEYHHPMPVGARTNSGWTTVRASALRDDQWVELRTRERPVEVKLDPEHLTVDWDRRNDALAPPAVRTVLDWPFLDQSSRDAEVVAVRQMLWYTDPGGLTPALRLRSNYQGDMDRWELGAALPVRAPAGDRLGRLQGWIATTNPNLPFAARPSVGLSAGAWFLDGLAKLDLRKQWDLSPFYYANGPHRTLTLALTSTLPYDRAWIDGARWENARVTDVSAAYDWRGPSPSGLSARGYVDGGIADESGPGSRGFARVTVEGSRSATFDRQRKLSGTLRLFAGTSTNAPVQRSIGLSSLDATDTFSDNLLRGAGAPLARSDVHFLPYGGAGVRGYSPLLRVKSATALNADVAWALNAPRGRSLVPRVSLGAFGDVAWAQPLDFAAALGGALGAVLGEPMTASHVFADAGVGVTFAGRLYDQPYAIRFDVPLWVRKAGLPGAARVGWVVSW